MRLLAEFPTLSIGVRLRQIGNGYLRARIRNFNEIARYDPVLVLTDLDTAICPATLQKVWLSRLPHPSPSLLLHVAVREIESWLLADHDAVVALLGKSVRPRLAEQPDVLADPKAFLLKLARHAPRAVRQDLLPEPGAIASKGLGYNERLCELVRTSWLPRRAAARSPSLHRTLGRIQELISQGLVRRASERYAHLA